MSLLCVCILIIDKTLRTCVNYHDAFPAFEPKLIFQIQEDQSAILWLPFQSSGRIFSRRGVDKTGLTDKIRLMNDVVDV